MLILEFVQHFDADDVANLLAKPDSWTDGEYDLFVAGLEFHFTILALCMGRDWRKLLGMDIEYAAGYVSLTYSGRRVSEDGVIFIVQGDKQCGS